MLEEGARRAAELRHPERGAAWLRAQLLRRLARVSSARISRGDDERRAALRQLGAADPLFDGLAGLSMRERVALVASAVERFDAADVETILGLRPGASPRLVGRAREHYLSAVAAAVPPNALGGTSGGGLVADRVRAVAGRMGFIAGDAR